MPHHGHDLRIERKLARTLDGCRRLAAVIIRHQLDAIAPHSARRVALAHRQSSRINRIIAHAPVAPFERRDQAKFDNRRRRAAAAGGKYQTTNIQISKSKPTPFEI